MAAIKHSISLREDLNKYSVNMANDYFQGNISAFIAYLIACHKNGKIEMCQFQTNGSEDIKVKKDPIVNTIIDDIDNFFNDN